MIVSLYVINAKDSGRKISVSSFAPVYQSLFSPFHSMVGEDATSVASLSLEHHGIGHRVLLRCRRSLNNLKLRRSAVATSPAARCATPKGSARGLLHQALGHGPLS